MGIGGVAAVVFAVIFVVLFAILALGPSIVGDDDDDAL